MKKIFFLLAIILSSPAFAARTANTADIAAFRKVLPNGRYTGTNFFSQGGPCTVEVTGDAKTYRVFVDPPWDVTGGEKAAFRVSVADPLFCSENEYSSCNVNFEENWILMTISTGLNSDGTFQVSAGYNGPEFYASGSCDIGRGQVPAPN